MGVGIISTSPKQSLDKRLLIIYKDLTYLINKYDPQTVALENLFFNTNAKTALLVGQARGVIMLAAAQKKLDPWYEWDKGVGWG